MKDAHQVSVSSGSSVPGRDGVLQSNLLMIRVDDVDPSDPVKLAGAMRKPVDRTS